MHSRRNPSLALATTLALIPLSGSAPSRAEIVRLKLQPEGWTERIGQYTPQRIDLDSSRPVTIQRLPDGLTNARYGVLPFRGPAGRARVGIVLDETPGRAPRLLVDANGNLDLTDDPPAEWREKRAPGTDGREFVHHTGHASLPLRSAPGEPIVRLGFYRFDPLDPANRQHASAIFCYADYGFEGAVTLGRATYRAAFCDDSASGVLRLRGEQEPTCSLLIDANSDGQFDRGLERFEPGKPIEVLGGIFEVTQVDPGGQQFAIETRREPRQSAAALRDPGTASPDPARSDASAAKAAQGVAKSFEATTLDGKTIRFPEDYKGKIVLLDFWATWCRPCLAELPGLAQAHERFSESGFSILGVSLDGKAALDKLPEFTARHKMNWPQICDGLGWNSRLGKLYQVRSIPQAFLVDGDSGAILATGSEVRGVNLGRTIEQALKERAARPKGPSADQNPQKGR